jgi:hypothetical protein
MPIATRIDIPESDHLIQPTIIRLNNSPQLRAFFRDEKAEWIYYADSNDDGFPWSTPKSTSLPNSRAEIEAYTFKNGAVIMAFNNIIEMFKFMMMIVYMSENIPIHR